MTENLRLSQSTVDLCLNFGVQTFVVCAGARNAPLVKVLGAAKTKTYHFPEERSAAFFALGMIQAQETPVAVIVTSGTAVAECLPAIVEAFYQSLPLIVISADRPRRFRGSGSPQSIEQVGIFSHYVEKILDIDAKSDLSEKNSVEWSKERPLQINVCIEEPTAEDFP
jgi:2-succinyl-5-enolpyruvyl-6-hydroxy-3-cyclohexene-1-carboxylate synthase